MVGGRSAWLRAAASGRAASTSGRVSGRAARGSGYAIPGLGPPAILASLLESVNDISLFSCLEGDSEKESR